MVRSVAAAPSAREENGTTMDRFDAIGKLEDQLADGFEGLTPDWEIRGADPVLRLRGEGVEVELVPQDDGRFRLETTADAEQVAKILALLTARRAAPSPAPGLRTRSRRLAAVS